MPPSAPIPADPAIPSAAITLHGASYSERGAQYVGKLHRRPVYQWYHVVYGEIEQRYQQRSIPLTAGCGIIYPPHILRGPRATGAQHRAPGYFWVMFSTHTINVDALCGHVVQPAQNLQPDIDAFIETMQVHDIPHRDVVQRVLVERLLCGLLLAQHRGSTVTRTPLNRLAEHGQVAQAQAFIEQHLAEPITRDDIAAAAHCSPAHLARLFRLELDRTVGEWLTERRLGQAKTWLVDSEYSIAQIAGRCGYGSYSHFTQLFRREVGITPSDYRRAGGKSWRRQ